MVTTRLVLAATLALVGALAPEPSRLPAAPKAAKTSSRRSALLGGVPAAVLLGGAAVANAATSDGDNEFKLADVNKDGKLTRNESRAASAVRRAARHRTRTAPAAAPNAPFCARAGSRNGSGRTRS
jgi:hypothetical protein